MGVSGGSGSDLARPALRWRGVEFFNLLVDDVDGVFNGGGGDPLQVGIEGGVDAEAFEVGVALADFLQELFVDEVDEVGCFAGVDAGGGEVERLLFGAFGLVAGDGAGFDHGIEHEIAAFDGAVGVAEGSEVVGPLDHAGEHGAFGEIELLNVFAEVGLGGFAEAVDGEAAALAEVDLVGVHLEDLLLGEAVFELEGDDDLDELALDALLRREEESARQLHGERGAALLLLAGASRRGGWLP